MSPKMEIYAGGNPLGFVISLNIHRRHLNEPQRGMVAAKLANLEQGQRADRADPQICVSTQTQAAELLNVSERTVNTSSVYWPTHTPEITLQPSSDS